MRKEKQQVSVLLDSELKEKLRRYAKENCRSLSGQVRVILKEHLAQRQSEQKRG